MNLRVTDQLVRDWLAWARNYEEIDGYEKIADRGKKWRISVPEGIVKAKEVAWLVPETSQVPTVLFLTSREALVFAMGCAVGGARERATWTAEDWQKQKQRKENT